MKIFFVFLIVIITTFTHEVQASKNCQWGCGIADGCPAECDSKYVPDGMEGDLYQRCLCQKDEALIKENKRDTAIFLCLRNNMYKSERKHPRLGLKQEFCENLQILGAQGKINLHLEWRDGEGRTAFLKLVSHAQIDKASTLVRLGANPKAIDNGGLNAAQIYAITTKCDLGDLKKLSSWGVPLDQPHPMLGPITRICPPATVDQVRFYKEKHLPFRFDQFPFSVLWWAIIQSNAEVAAEVLKTETGLENAGPSGGDILEAALANCQNVSWIDKKKQDAARKIVEMLLNHNIKPQAKHEKLMIGCGIKNGSLHR